MKQYPIWNRVTSCIYKGGKSYGVKERGEVEVLVGTSSRNSYRFLVHNTTCKIFEDGSREFRFYVDGKLIKRAVMPKGKAPEFVAASD